MQSGSGRHINSGYGQFWHLYSRPDPYIILIIQFINANTAAGKNWPKNQVTAPVNDIVIKNVTFIHCNLKAIEVGREVRLVLLLLFRGAKNLEKSLTLKLTTFDLFWQPSSAKKGANFCFDSQSSKKTQFLRNWLAMKFSLLVNLTFESSQNKTYILLVIVQITLPQPCTSLGNFFTFAHVQKTKQVSNRIEEPSPLPYT